MRVAIEDTGVGIPKEKMHLLFTAFTKVMDNRSLNKEGCGLGLTISKMIAKALGGDIQMESETGLGSKFTLYLPLRKTEDENNEDSLMPTISDSGFSNQSKLRKYLLSQESWEDKFLSKIDISQKHRKSLTEHSRGMRLTKKKRRDIMEE